MKLPKVDSRLCFGACFRFTTIENSTFLIENGQFSKTGKGYILITGAVAFVQRRTTEHIENLSRGVAHET